MKGLNKNHTRVKTNVFFVVARVEELFFTIFTFVDALTSMYPQVHLEITIVFVGLTAQVAYEGPFTFLLDR